VTTWKAILPAKDALIDWNLASRTNSNAIPSSGIRWQADVGSKISQHEQRHGLSRHHGRSVLCRLISMYALRYRGRRGRERLLVHSWRSCHLRLHGGGGWISKAGREGPAPQYQVSSFIAAS
jgi:hypothetical protein